MSGNSSIRINNIQVKNYPDSSDQVIAWSNTSNATVLLPVSNFFNGSNNNLQVNTLIITNNTTPINSVQSTTQGKIWTDGNYLYIGIANNQIKRIALSSF